ncbi:unnamed protein product [Durusdinium trenchii]|uniref:Uncharacterized protein n=2 Tax=Durusdinium trenchii TaxID=1381693 RepID=A0ABP0L7H1_9DINO
MKLDMLKHGDVMDIQAEMQKGNWSFFSASRPDGILNQKFTQLLVACEVVSVMYNGLSSATMSQPQSLKFHQSLLPAKYEGSFWMTGLKVWLGDHCNGGWRPRGFKHAQLLGLTVLGEANSEEEPSNKSINLQVPQEGAALCPPRTFAFGLEVSFFDAGDKWWSEIVSEDECKEDGAMMETLQVFCKSLPLGHYSDPVQRASSRKVFIENPKANATRSAMCPENTFISHVAITPKGTCFHHCDEDGAIVQSISLECHPVCNFNQNVSCPRAAA